MGSSDMHEHHSHSHGHAHSHDHHAEPMGTEDAIGLLLVLGQTALDAGDYEAATDAYASLLKLDEHNETALYNLASFYARGLGVRQDFTEAARLFHQAELLGNEQAGRLCGKCMYDCQHEGFDGKSPADLYAAMAVFISRVYPEADDKTAEVNRGLYAIAATHLNRQEYAEAASFLRAAAEYCHDGFAQYYLGMLYNVGGLRKNDFAALYWLDCAVDNGAANVAISARDNILEAYRHSLSASAFRELMAQLAEWCEQGTPDIPSDPAKAARWRDWATPDAP